MGLKEAVVVTLVTWKPKSKLYRRAITFQPP